VKADLAAPATTPDGRLDFSGIWQFRLPVSHKANIVADL
jgi:hypothetical protein